MAKQDLHQFPCPSPSLAGRILLRIEYEERRRLRIKAGIFGSILVISIGIMAYGSSVAAAQAAHTGFWTFFSLIFTDFGATIATFSDFMFSMAETFPVFPAALLLSGLMVAVWSAAKFTADLVLLRDRSRAATAGI